MSGQRVVWYVEIQIFSFPVNAGQRIKWLVLHNLSRFMLRAIEKCKAKEKGDDGVQNNSCKNGDE